MVAATYETLIGLLATTGIRISEAIKLDNADIDWQQGVLLVRESKFNKSRYLPVQASTLERYARERERLCPNPRDPTFFVSLRRRRLDDCAVHVTFRRLCEATGVGAGAPFPPRLHDLRHTMAVKTLLGRYREGVDVHSRLPALSTYLGDLNPAYTYYYLAAAPELLTHAAGCSMPTRRHGHDPDRPNAAGVLHRPPDQAAARQPAHDRLRPRHPAPAAVLRARPNRDRPDGAGLERPRRAADHRVSRGR